MTQGPGGSGGQPPGDGNGWGAPPQGAGGPPQGPQQPAPQQGGAAPPQPPHPPQQPPPQQGWGAQPPHPPQQPPPQQGWGAQPPQGGGAPPPPQPGWAPQPAPGQPPAGGPPQQPFPQGGGAPPGGPQQQYGAGAFEQLAQSGYQPDAEECDQAFYAHLSAAAVAFLTCGMLLPVAAPLLVYAMAKEKKPFMLYHVNQSVLFQAGMFVVNFGIAAVATVLTAFCIGFLVWLIYPLTWLAAVVYPLIVAFNARRGDWGGYAIIADKLRREWKPLIN